MKAMHGVWIMHKRENRCVFLGIKEFNEHNTSPQAIQAYLDLKYPQQTHCEPGRHLGMGGGYHEICEVCGKNVYS